MERARASNNNREPPRTDSRSPVAGDVEVQTVTLVLSESDEDTEGDSDEKYTARCTFLSDGDDTDDNDEPPPVLRDTVPLQNAHTITTGNE